MKSLMSGCAAAALLVCLAAQAHAQTAVRDAPVHAVPMDEDDAPAAEPTAPVADKAEPAPVKALTLPKAPPAPARPCRRRAQSVRPPACCPRPSGQPAQERRARRFEREPQLPDP